MSGESISINTVYEIAKQYFPEGHLRVEIWDVGLRFVWETEDSQGSAFLQEPLSLISEFGIRGFLDAEIRINEQIVKAE
ncbi:hypothetical protein IFU23_23340 [Pantoea agglomerans]|uniref:hypothetical protein n=1 Tax=Enterobacter agglomerans TaxID=549 RepID=UPI0017871A08|nr:hypothetical protein [Pantoea agglomerans]MBD8161024.1 hypothetical protein [Pantoea agglomerans]